MHFIIDGKHSNERTDPSCNQASAPASASSGHHPPPTPGPRRSGSLSSDAPQRWRTILAARHTVSILAAGAQEPGSLLKGSRRAWVLISLFLPSFLLSLVLSQSLRGSGPHSTFFRSLVDVEIELAGIRLILFGSSEGLRRRRPFGLARFGGGRGLRVGALFRILGPSRMLFSIYWVPRGCASVVVSSLVLGPQRRIGLLPVVHEESM